VYKLESLNYYQAVWSSRTIRLNRRREKHNRYFGCILAPRVWSKSSQLQLRELRGEWKFRHRNWVTDSGTWNKRVQSDVLTYLVAAKFHSNWSISTAAGDGLSWYTVQRNKNKLDTVYNSHGLLEHMAAAGGAPFSPVLCWNMKWVRHLRGKQKFWIPKFWWQFVWGIYDKIFQYMTCWPILLPK
jgi:hypothetical protein